jgi:hypothetical protein
MEQQVSAHTTLKENNLSSQLALKTNTLKHLETLLMESETKLNKSEHDKEKLESFAKKSLANFKDKYVAIIQKNKTDKQILEQKFVSFLFILKISRFNALNEKYEKEQERFRREERLILSAMYEVECYHKVILILYRWECKQWKEILISRSMSLLPPR